jgi:type II restriction/modification system DNA methylase subunit YeeA
LLGFFNSTLFQWAFKNIVTNMGQGFEYKIQFIVNIPIPPITPSNKPIVEQIEQLVDNILNAKRQDPRADTTDNETQIDHLVYQLYSLTEEEIGIIENSFGGVK